MSALVQCAPSFGEGRDASVLDEIVAAMVAVPGVRLRGRCMDADHNRSVVTLEGSPEAVGEAAFRGVAEAVRLIDLRSRGGEGPRMAAAEAVPFTPLGGVDLAECVALARRVGERIGRELGLPVFLYGEAATRPECRDLSAGAQLQGLPSLVGGDPARLPDFGPHTPHPTAGAVAVGAVSPAAAGGGEDAPLPRYVEQSIVGYSELVAGGTPVPGGGNVAAVVGALAASLALMVSRLTQGRPKFAAVAEKMREVEARAEPLRVRLLELADADSAAYTAYMGASRAAKQGAADGAKRVQEAALRATEVPLEGARASVEVMELALEAAKLGMPAARTDALVGVIAGHAAALSGCLNVRTNLSFFKLPSGADAMRSEVEALEQRAEALLAETLSLGRG